jgi:hypothetical protein
MSHTILGSESSIKHPLVREEEKDGGIYEPEGNSMA